MSQRTRRRIRIHVEGCLDAVLVNLLLENVGLRRDQYEIPMPSGGWPGTLRKLREDLSKGVRAIAFIDADQGIQQALKRVENTVVNFRLKLLTDPAPHIIIRRDSTVTSTVIIWTKPPEYNMGTVEDLICWIIGEDLCVETQQSLEKIARRISSTTKDTKEWLRKLAPLVILSLHTEHGTLIWTPEYQRCGIDLRQTLKKYLDHKHVEPYIALLRNTLQLLLFQ